MYGDILPPRQVKPKKTKSKPEKSSASVHHARTSASAKPPVIEPEIDASTIKPLEIETSAKAKKVKRVSLRNIKGNLRPKHWYNLTREEQWVLFGGLLSILIGVVLCLFVFFKGHDYTPPQTPVIKAAPKPDTVEAPLTGLQISPDLAKRPVTAIMIENSMEARPQSGLQQAGVVYEAIAEGGITRFIALFQDTRPSYIGPVRSLRPYYIDFAAPWDAAIAHVGGSPDALSQIRSGGKDLDQFFNAGAYWRQNTRDAPHNVYTDFDRLDALNTAKGYTASIPQSWPHKKDSRLATPSAKSVNLNVSSSLYNVHYDYDASSNSYIRNLGGQPHLVTTSPDNKSTVQLKPKVAIAIVMSYGIQSDGKHSEYGVNDGGNVYIFQDGGLSQGMWSKADRNSQFVFKDSAGTPIKLNAGQAWVTILSADNQVQYTP